eukprot:3221369-Prymnesium_polylepis.1
MYGITRPTVIAVRCTVWGAPVTSVTNVSCVGLRLVSGRRGRYVLSTRHTVTDQLPGGAVYGNGHHQGWRQPPRRVTE